MKEKKKKLDFKESKRNLKMSWKFAKKNKKFLIGYSIFHICLCLIGVLAPVLSAKQLLFLSDSVWESLRNISIFIFIVEISRNICRYLSNKMGQLFFRETLIDLQLELARATLELETEEIDNHSSGIFIDRLNKDTTDIAEIFNLFTNSITDVIVNIGIIGAVFVVNRVIFLYFFVALLILFVLKRMSIKTRYEINKKFRELSEKNTGLIGEMVRGLRDVKSLGAEDNFMDIVSKRLVESNEKRYQMDIVNRIYNFITGSLQDLFELGFIFLESS